MDKVGDKITMVIASIMCLPYIACFIIVGLKSIYFSNNSWYFGNMFVYIIVLVTSLINGLGEGFV